MQWRNSLLYIWQGLIFKNTGISNNFLAKLNNQKMGNRTKYTFILKHTNGQHVYAKTLNITIKKVHSKAGRVTQVVVCLSRKRKALHSSPSTIKKKRKHIPKPQWDIISLQYEWLLSKRQKTTSAGEDVEQRELLHTLDGNIN
jgi:hypothetical protein